MAITMRAWALSAAGREYELVLPAVRVVCPVCDGSGKHVNPAIDGHGLGPEDFEDQDFAESYWSGAYDVQCEECNGRNVVEELDWERIGREWPRIAMAVQRSSDRQAADRAEAAWERRFCV